jgi:hypothetical protein
MAFMKMDSIETLMNGQVEVKLDVRTSVGKLIVPFKFEDQGSAAENEKRAIHEFGVWLHEALEAFEALQGR